jgi:hypothetical protein
MSHNKIPSYKNYWESYSDLDSALATETYKAIIYLLLSYLISSVNSEIFNTSETVFNQF